MAFYQHIGPRPSTSHSVDRIDNSKGYEPGNVRWATATEQARNRRNNVVTEINGERLTATDVCRIHGLNFKSVTRLIRAGHTGDEVLALATPVRRRA